MIVRHADPAADAQACADIYAPFVADSPATFETEPVDADAMRRRMELVAARHAWLVSEDDAGVAGYAYAGPHRDRAAYRWAADVAVYIHPRAHGKGHGRALYERLLPLLRAQNVYVAVAGISQPNAASVALHAAFGFELVGVYRDIGFKAGAWRDVAWYQLQLTEPPPGEPPEVLPPGR